MENPASITLIIKAANQKSADFSIECELNWSVKYLKSYLSKNYPTKPNDKTIRLIYSGKQLNDEMLLKDCIRLNNETNVHNIHMVYKASTLNEDESSSNNNNKNNPCTSRNSDIEQINENINRIAAATLINQQNSVNFEQMTQKEQHQFIYNQLRNYYSSMGVSMSNSWNISYLHHTALYYQMYTNYMRSIGVNTGIELNNTLPINHNNNNSTNTSNVDANNNNENIQNNNNQQAANNAADADLRADEREDDWLSILYNLSSFFVLFSIVYFYSTFTRFMIVFVSVLLLVLYQSGWFALERRNARPANEAQPNQDNNNNQENNNNNNNNNTDDAAAAAPQTPAVVATGPNIFRLAFSFVITFFTSLVPERARIPN